MNCQTRKFTVTASSAAGQLIHFKPECHCWGCDHCRPKLVSKHVARVNRLFVDDVFHIAVSARGWEALYMRAYRFATRASYVRITVGDVCHLFFDRSVPGATKHTPDAAIRMAQARLKEITAGGAHVSYSTAWQEQDHEKPAKKWKMQALGISRRIFEAVAQVAKAPLATFHDSALIGKCQHAAEDLVLLMKNFGALCKRFSQEDHSSAIPINAYAPASGRSFEHAAALSSNTT